MLKKTLLAYTIGFAFSPPANADGIEGDAANLLI